MPTFSELLDRRTRDDAARPWVTFYDFTTGERTELSVATYANWVAKAAGLLVDEQGLERGDVLRVDLPTHWLGPVFLGAAWSAGLVVDLESEDASAVDAVVCGPDGVGRWEPAAGGIPVLASALRPLGVRFADPLPAGVLDIGVEIWSLPDSFVALDPPEGADPALRADGSTWTQDELWSTAAAGALVSDGGRLLTGANPASPPGVAALTEPLVRGGSLVLVTPSGPDHADRVSATYDAERATARLD